MPPITPERDASRKYLDADGNPVDAPATAENGTPPIDDYDELTVEQVLAEAEKLNAEQRATVREYEEANKGRKGVREGLDALAEEEDA